MGKRWPTDPVLWVEASGPLLAVGVLGPEGVEAEERGERAVLEALTPAVESVLAGSGRGLGDLGGVILGGGPGSSLGLRLSAMMVRTLLRMPGLGHWRCWQYHLLEVAAVSLMEAEADVGRATALAPFRKDCWHRVTGWRAAGGWHFERGTVPAGERVDGKAVAFEVGNRRFGEGAGEVVSAGALADRIPEILRAHPGLLWEASEPGPVRVEVTEYARWEGRRHGGA